MTDQNWKPAASVCCVHCTCSSGASVREWSCFRSGSKIASQSYVAITRADRSLRSTVSTTNVCASTATRTCGSTSRTCLTICLWRLLLKDRYIALCQSKQTCHKLCSCPTTKDQQHHCDIFHCTLNVSLRCLVKYQNYYFKISKTLTCITQQHQFASSVHWTESQHALALEWN